MKIIDPGYTIPRPQAFTPDTVAAIYSAIATAARTCCQSTRADDVAQEQAERRRDDLTGHDL